MPARNQANMPLISEVRSGGFFLPCFTILYVYLGVMQIYLYVGCICILEIVRLICLCVESNLYFPSMTKELEILLNLFNISEVI